MFPNFFVVCIELCLVVLSVPFEVTKDALHSGSGDMLLCHHC